MRPCPFCAEQVQDAAVLCKHCGKAIPAAMVADRPSSPKPNPEPGQAGSSRGKSRRWLLLGLLLIVAILVVYRANRGAGRGSLASIVTPPRVVTIQSTEFDVPAGSIYRWEYSAEPSQPTCNLVGHLEVLSGGNKDVMVYVLSSDDYANLQNGHDARAFFQTPKTSAVTLDVTTRTAGKLVLAVSNTFSLLIAKRVRINDGRVTCQ